ncbi:IQ motif and ubiquitin-like domain-containing protein [Rhopilema esculentum]|eukprot:gene8509-14508_t
MLLALRHSEEEYSDGSKIAFIIQEADLRYLVENIWNGQSCLSAWEDLHDLVLVRWNKHEHWAPWNCILLTKEEAAAHSKLENVNEGYGRIFIGKVHNRHVLAQKHFSKLTDVADKMQTKGTVKARPKAQQLAS